MVKIDLVTGFLGAGKTTFIGHYAKYLNSVQTSFAVIENDFGRSCVDSAILEQLGIGIRELSGGCICCGLKLGFHDMLLELASHGSCDRIIVEPSGIFDPFDFFEVALSPDVSALASVGSVIAVADPVTIDEPDENLSLMLCRQLHCANTVMISRAATQDDSFYARRIEKLYARHGFSLPSEQTVCSNQWKLLNDEFFGRIASSEVSFYETGKCGIDHSSLFNSTSISVSRAFEREELLSALTSAFDGSFGKLIRLKGCVPAASGGLFLVNCTPDSINVSDIAEGVPVSLNAIGTGLNRRGISALFSQSGK